MRQCHQCFVVFHCFLRFMWTLPCAKLGRDPCLVDYRIDMPRVSVAQPSPLWVERLQMWCCCGICPVLHTPGATVSDAGNASKRPSMMNAETGTVSLAFVRFIALAPSWAFFALGLILISQNYRCFCQAKNWTAEDQCLAHAWLVLSVKSVTLVVGVRSKLTLVDRWRLKLLAKRSGGLIGLITFVCLKCLQICARCKKYRTL